MGAAEKLIDEVMALKLTATSLARQARDADREGERERGTLKDGGKELTVESFLEILRQPMREPEKGSEWKTLCENILEEASAVLDPSVPSGQELLDFIGGDLLGVVVQYVGVSQKCDDISTTIIKALASVCNPREMFTAFFEVINMYSKPQDLHLCLPLVHGLSIVFPRIKRRQAQFFKEAVPGLLLLARSSFQVEMDMMPNDEEEISGTPEVPGPAVQTKCAEDNTGNQILSEIVLVVKVIRVCDAVQDKQKLLDMLALFTLRLLVVATASTTVTDSTVPEAVMKVMELLSFCELSLQELLTTARVKQILDLLEEDDDEVQDCRFEAEEGVALAVYWWTHNKESVTATEVFDMLKDMFQASGSETVHNIINMASILLVPIAVNGNKPFTQQGLILLTFIIDVHGETASTDSAMRPDDGILHPQLIVALQRLQDAVVHTPNPMLRRQAYYILIKIIKQALPASARFETLLTLISDGLYPSLVSLLLNALKDEVANAWPTADAKLIPPQNSGNLAFASGRVSDFASPSSSPFVTEQVHRIIESVIRKDGYLADIPLDLDPVLSALNLYRFILIRESSGNTDYTKVLSIDNLERTRVYWLLPLREHALRAQATIEKEKLETTHDMLLGIDCLLSVIYRCLELVEQNLSEQKKVASGEQ